MTQLQKDIYQPETNNRQAQRAVLIVTADKTEDLEFFYPYYRFIEAGFKVDVATPSGGAFKGKQGLGLQETVKIDSVDAKNYELLYLPGGKAPAELRSNKDVLTLTQKFVMDNKPVAAICHGPQILAAADVIRGRKIAAWPEVEPEVTAAGATYHNQETLVDGPFITARWPGDLPAHMLRVLDVLGHRQENAGDVFEPHAAA